MRPVRIVIFLGGMTFTSPSALGAETSLRTAASVHGGWWDVGGEVQTPWGIFGGLGVPWIAYTPLFVYSGHEGTVAADARLGYSTPQSDGLSLRALVLSAWIYQWGEPCGDGCTVYEHKVYNFLSGGLRYRLPSGVLLGLEVPLVAVELNHSQERDETGWHAPEWFPPPIAAALTQAYVGYGWGL